MWLFKDFFGTNFLSQRLHSLTLQGQCSLRMCHLNWETDNFWSQNWHSNVSLWVSRICLSRSTPACHICRTSPSASLYLPCPSWPPCQTNPCQCPAKYISPSVSSSLTSSLDKNFSSLMGWNSKSMLKVKKSDNSLSASFWSSYAWSYGPKWPTHISIPKKNREKGLPCGYQTILDGTPPQGKNFEPIMLFKNRKVLS